MVWVDSVHYARIGPIIGQSVGNAPRRRRAGMRRRRWSRVCRFQSWRGARTRNADPVLPMLRRKGLDRLIAWLRVEKGEASPIPGEAGWKTCEKRRIRAWTTLADAPSAATCGAKCGRPRREPLNPADDTLGADYALTTPFGELHRSINRSMNQKVQLGVIRQSWTQHIVQL